MVCSFMVMAGRDYAASFGTRASPSSDLIVLALALRARCIDSLQPHLAGLWLQLVCSFATVVVQGRPVPTVDNFLANPRWGWLASPCLPVHEAMVPTLGGLPTLATGLGWQQPTGAHA